MAGILNAVKNSVLGTGGPAPPPPPEWLTRMAQCDPPAKVEEWFFALFCFQCAQASAKGKADGSHCFYNFLCWHHIGTYSWIRRGYHIPGTCGDDMMCGLFCYPCTIRRVLTETAQRGQVVQIGNMNDGKWIETLFGCGCCGLFQAAICPFCVAHEARLLLQPQGETDTCFDWLCLIPTALYGQTRHSFNLKSDCPLIEDILLPVVCYPCAVDQARRECTRRAGLPEYIARQSARHAGIRIPGIV